MLWAKCLRKVSGKFCVINYIFYVCKRLKEGHENCLSGFNFLCKRLKIGKCFSLESQKIWGRGTAITALGDTNPSDATGVGYWTLKKCPLFHLRTYGNPNNTLSKLYEAVIKADHRLNCFIICSN